MQSYVLGEEVGATVGYRIRRETRVGTGTRVEVVTDRLPAIDSDLRAWCRATGHRLVEADQDAGTLPPTPSRREAK